MFEQFDIFEINHYAPLHYLPFIARSGQLLPKPDLYAAGFSDMHFRSKSNRQDLLRGFRDCAFLTIDKFPRILGAKLAAGFPHIAIRVPSQSIERSEFSLCRYNIAMTRVLRRDGMPGRQESSTNGRYYGNRAVPIARKQSDKLAMLRKHLSIGTMIEVLVHGPLDLPSSTTVTCYHDEDARIAYEVLDRLDRKWNLEVEVPPSKYNRSKQYVTNVTEFISTALADPEWRGNGLEFDRV